MALDAKEINPNPEPPPWTLYAQAMFAGPRMPERHLGSKSISESTDLELAALLPSDVVGPLSGEWKTALDQTQKTLETAASWPPDALRFKLGQTWSALNAKLKLLVDHPVVRANSWMDDLISQLRTRLAKLRVVGIMPGDPREEEILVPKVAPPGSGKDGPT